MTRSVRATRPVAARRKAPASATALSEPASLKFLVFENNGGAYYWTIVAGRGETLVRSASFATYEEAKQAACIAHAGVGSASLEHLAGDGPPVDLVARRQVGTVRHGLTKAAASAARR